MPEALVNPALALEEQLQQELRGMFEVDTQTYLQTYFSLVQQLNPAAWVADIQELYRCIHTIKGGAVTVGADPIVQVSSVLEDLLSDLRYLQTAPVLDDGHLRQALLESGELLTGSLQIQASGEAAIIVVQPTVDRIQALRETIKLAYLPEWDEHSQLYQEFAEQGFDLVVLDLELALEDLPAEGSVPTATLNVAKLTLQQLLQIGRDLDFQPGWTTLLRRSRILLTRLEIPFWKSHWPVYLQLLKQSARQGGILPTPAQPKPPDPTIAAIVHLSPVTVSFPTAAPIVPSIQIPVPLERLDQSAQTLVETLLASRATQGSYQTLESQLGQLVALAQDSTQYITRLRQLQDEYALLESLPTDPTAGPKLEGYRQGYTVINRLLEVSLRLSELGEETATTARQTATSLDLLDRNILNLQGTLEASRLVPFKTVGFRARGILRDLTNRYEKPAQLQIRGENLELDAGTVQTLEPALLHLLRNAYDHGLESPAERLAHNKTPEGTITLSLQRRGNTYLLEVQDDGAGIQASVIAAVAQAKQLPLTRTDTPAQLLAVLCQPGFSSRDEVSEISGRGVGMDVVASQVKSLGGRLSLETRPGSGTTFQLQIPVPRLLVRCVLTRAGELVFAIPADEITTTTLFSSLEATPQGQLWQIQTGSVAGLGLDLLHYWQPQTEPRPLPETAVCLQIQTGSGQTCWLLADDLLGQSDLLISPLPLPLVPPVGLVGVSLQTDGRLVPVLDPAQLAERLVIGSGDAFAQPPASPIKPSLEIVDEQTAQTILVVDDAALVRRRIEASLSAYGFTVQTCRDGLEAWNWLQTHPDPMLMITDIEMPVMDGFTLISRCRQAGSKVPVLVISSRLSEEWSQEANRLGATDYLTKGFATAELIEKVNHLIKQPQPTLN